MLQKIHASGIEQVIQVRLNIKENTSLKFTILVEGWLPGPKGSSSTRMEWLCSGP